MGLRPRGRLEGTGPPRIWAVMVAVAAAEGLPLPAQLVESKEETAATGSSTAYPAPTPIMPAAEEEGQRATHLPVRAAAEAPEAAAIPPSLQHLEMPAQAAAEAAEAGRQPETEAAAAQA